MSDIKWLFQYIRESQAMYPCIYKTPIDVLRHLLFTNGNGVELLNGDFIKRAAFGRSVPFVDYYKEQVTFKKLKEYLDERSDSKVEEIYKRKKGLIELKNKLGIESTKSEECLWEESTEEFYNRYDGLLIVDSFSEVDLQDEEVLLDMLYKCDYQPYLVLSEGYYKLNFFNNSTNKGLVKVGVATCKAYITYLSKLVEDPSLIVNSPMPKTNYGEERQGRLLEVYKKDIDTLSKEVARLVELLEV